MCVCVCVCVRACVCACVRACVRACIVESGVEEEERRKGMVNSIHMVLHCNGDGYVNVCGGCWQFGWVRGC